MTAIPPVLLPDRGVVAVTGPDAAKLLKGLVTNDIPGTGTDATFAGLLSPQGKIQFDFLIAAVADGFLLDVQRDRATDLVKRLTIYRLRSNVEIADRSAELAVTATWNGTAETPDAIVNYADPRLAALGRRAILHAGNAPAADAVLEHAYHAHRIALGVPDGGRDYVFGDAFPHEALFDQLHGVSFAKGCYVGQEIVSRMEHRGTARKRIVKVQAEGLLPSDHPEVMAGDVAIGGLGSVAGREGLAMVRLDRAAEFAQKGISLTAGGSPLALSKPAFATFAFEPVSASPAQA